MHDAKPSDSGSLQQCGINLAEDNDGGKDPLTCIENNDAVLRKPMPAFPDGTERERHFEFADNSMQGSVTPFLSENVTMREDDDVVDLQDITVEPLSEKDEDFVAKLHPDNGQHLSCDAPSRHQTPHKNFHQSWIDRSTHSDCYDSASQQWPQSSYNRQFSSLSDSTQGSYYKKFRSDFHQTSFVSRPDLITGSSGAFAHQNLRDPCQDVPYFETYNGSNFDGVTTDHSHQPLFNSFVNFESLPQAYESCSMYR